MTYLYSLRISCRARWSPLACFIGLEWCTPPHTWYRQPCYSLHRVSSCAWSWAQSNISPALWIAWNEFKFQIAEQNLVFTASHLARIKREKDCINKLGQGGKLHYFDWVFLVKKLNTSPQRMQLFSPSPAALFRIFWRRSMRRLKINKIRLKDKGRKY